MVRHRRDAISTLREPALTAELSIQRSYLERLPMLSCLLCQLAGLYAVTDRPFPGMYEQVSIGQHLLACDQEVELLSA